MVKKRPRELTESVICRRVVANHLGVAVTGKGKLARIIRERHPALDRGSNKTVIETYARVVVRWEPPPQAVVRPDPPKKVPRPPAPPPRIDPASTDFLQTYAWRRLRMEVLKERGRRCECCGAHPDRDPDVRVNVDHVKPRARYPELALEKSNLQVLCHECNHGKGNWDETDWRPRPS